ncbi:MAG: OmpA family protein [Cyclobacteriaceae bacterium]
MIIRRRKLKVYQVTLISLIGLFLTTNLHAQKEEKIYKNALEAFYEEDFEDAIVLFNEVIDINSKYKDSDYRLELCSLLIKENRERPLDQILSYSETRGKKDKFYNYWIGRVYANRYMFPEAVIVWKKFLKQKAYKSKEIVEETKDFIKETKKLVAFFDNPDNYEIHQLEAPINTKFGEMSPVYFEGKKELIYASSQDSRNEIYKIYHSIRSGYDWSEPTELTTLGKFEKTNANVEVVNEDGKLFMFHDKKESLTFSEPTEDGWSAPREFDSHISSKNLASHFFINTHEDRIIFVSKHKHDGLDLHETFRDANSGKWSKPTPLPGIINSSFDEESPYLSPDEQKLYFSSTRPGGVGGFDVYVSEFDSNSKTWKEPVNIGWPINSPDDDLHFKMNDDQESGYFISDRIYSKGDYDIFFFWEIEKAYVEGRIINALTDEVITSGEIRFHPSQYLVEYFRSQIDEKGRYKTEIISDEKFQVEIINGLDTLGVDLYEIHDSQGETLTHVQDFYAISKTATPEEISIYKQKSLLAKQSVPANDIEATPVQSVPSEKPAVEQQPLKEEPKAIAKSENTAIEKVENLGSKYRVSNKAILRNIYFESGTAQLTNVSDEVLNSLLNTMKGNTSLRIEVGGHTDNIGEEDVNMWMSQNRAEAIKKWLVKNGINKNRIIAKGYGESKPLASNDDEENGRELNRRIEILVIE